MNGLKLFNGLVGYRDIPKSACTSIKLELYHLMAGNEFNAADHGGKHIHQYMNSSFNTEIDDCDFRFIVVRDPIKRFLSGYSNRVLHHRELSREYISTNHKALLDEIPVFDPSLSEFIEHLDIYLKVSPIHHHIKQITSFLGNEDLECFSHVYKIENSDQLASDLSKTIEKPVTFGREQTGGKKINVHELTKQQANYLLEFYDADYKLLEGLYSKSDILKQVEAK